MSKKVLIIGLDGGCWKVFDTFIERGYMPNLRALKETGVSGILKSTIPPITPAAWTSFQTGTKPGKHGIFDFIQFNKEKKEFNLVSSDLIRVETIFDYLSKNGLKVISINLPLTYPPKAVNGIMISCFLTPNLKSDFVYPFSLKEEILNKFPNYTISPEEIFYKYNPYQGKFDNFLLGMADQVQEKKDLAKYLINNKQWDLIFIQFQSLDSLQHALWPYIDKDHPLFEEAKYNQIANSYFAKLDNAIGEIVENAKSAHSKSDLMAILLSDHGFKRVEKIFNLPGWLVDNRYLVNNYNAKVGIKENFITLAIKLDKYNLRKRIPFFRAFRNKHKELFSNHIKASIDFNRSKVVYIPITGWGNLFLLDSSDNFKNRIIRNLENIIDEDGNKVIKKIHHKDEIYNHKDSNLLPDLILEPADGYVIEAKASIKKDKKIFRIINVQKDNFIGNHDIDGIFVFNGVDVLKKEKTETINIWDIAPTIIYFLGLPVADYMDGKVCKELFTGKIIGATEINYIDVSSDDYHRDYSDKDKMKDEEEVRKRLQILGYM